MNERKRKQMQKQVTLYMTTIHELDKAMNTQTIQKRSEIKV